MIQPQSDEDLAPIVAEMQRLDPLLGLRWDSEAVMVERGSYSVMGVRVDGKYDGRWSVIRYDDANVGHAGFHEGRGYTVLCHLTEWTRDDGVIRMVSLRDGGKYAPVGEWVVEMLRQADGQNVARFEEMRRRLDALEERADRAVNAEDEAQFMEALDHNHFTANFAGGVGNWQGKGADYGAMERAAAARTKQAVSTILAPR